MKHTQLFVTFAATLVLTAACAAAPGPTQAPLPTYTPYPTYTPFPAPTAPPTAIPIAPTSTLAPTVEPIETAVPAPAQVFSYQGVTLTRPNGVGIGLSGKVVLEVKGDENTPDFAAHPRYIEISFQGYPSANKYHQPRLEIYKVADLQKGSDHVKGTVLRLQELLAQHAPLASAASQLPTQPLPFLPVFNAAQIIHAKGQYVAFKNGSGIRYVTQFDQAFLPINNQEIIYTYQGLSADGKYYLVAVLPVAAPVLAPNDDYKATGTAFIPFPTDAANAQVVQQYFNDVLSRMDALADNKFTPSLALLDAMLQTVELQ